MDFVTVWVPLPCVSALEPAGMDISRTQSTPLGFLIKTGKTKKIENNQKVCETETDSLKFDKSQEPMSKIKDKYFQCFRIITQQFD